MPKIFISSNRHDAEVAEKLEARLRQQHLPFWRADSDFYGTPGWPKTIGEAIAAHDLFLALWSQHAAISHIIEFEWQMAQLLQRRIIALRLDDAPLREKMQPDRHFRWPLAPKAEPDFWAILRQSAPDFDADTVQNVIKKLSRFNETKPAQVTRKMRIVYFNSRIDNPKMEF